MSRRRKFLLIVSVLLWEIIDISFVFVVPIYAAIFADWETPLPAITQGWINLADFRHNHIEFSNILFFGSLILAAMVAVKKEKRRLAMLFVAVSFSTFILFVGALVFPVWVLGK